MAHGPKLIERDARNRPTAQALARGATQRWLDSKPNYLRDVSLNLWQEHSAYHVRAHDFKERGRIFWDSYRTLTEARKRFASSKAHLRQAFAHRKEG